ncbi:hypothetical protein KR059_009206, partial [Drosophila kikkawai]
VSITYILINTKFFFKSGQAWGQYEAVDQAIAWANNVYQTVGVVTREKLPVTASAQKEGQDMLDTFKLGLTHCETELKATRNVDQHRTCVNALTAGYYASLGQLAGELWAIHGATSGASRLTLFW